MNRKFSVLVGKSNCRTISIPSSPKRVRLDPESRAGKECSPIKMRKYYNGDNSDTWNVVVRRVSRPASMGLRFPTPCDQFASRCMARPPQRSDKYGRPINPWINNLSSIVKAKNQEMAAYSNDEYYDMLMALSECHGQHYVAAKRYIELYSNRARHSHASKLYSITALYSKQRKDYTKPEASCKKKTLVGSKKRSKYRNSSSYRWARTGNQYSRYC